MKRDENVKLFDLHEQLSKHLRSAALYAQKICTESNNGNGNGHGAMQGTDPGKGNSRPIADISTMSVYWRGRSVHLGHTIGFRVLERLARHPQQYVSYTDLRQNAWNNRYVEPTTVRSLVRELRRKLRAGGMKSLAAAIQGENEHYVLKI